MRAIAAGAAIALAASLVAACGSDTGAGNDSSAGAGSSSSEGSADTSSTSSEGSASSGSDPSSESDGSASSGSSGGSASSGEQSSESDAHPSGDGHVTIPIAAGWDEDVAVTQLWKYVLEDEGYVVDTPMLDIAPIFKGVASSDFDLFFDTALPLTHANYWKRYGDRVADLGVWLDTVTNTIAVPAYMEIDSLEDLASIAGKVDKTIVGIDPGAGLTNLTQNKMMPAYGLDSAGWTLKTSSTPAMLAALKKAIDGQEPIVVTLWRPHWAYSAFELKDLKDPKGGMGEPDSIHMIASKDFVAEHPDLAEQVKDFHMEENDLNELEKVVLQDYGDGKYQEGVAAWAADHQEFVDGMLD